MEDNRTFQSLGDCIKFVDKQADLIIERKTGEFKMYGVVRLQLICQRFQEDDVSGTSVNKSPDVDFKIV